MLPHLLLFLVAAVGSDYTEARKAHLLDRQPLVVLVTADWCPGCRVVKPHEPALQRLYAKQHYARIDLTTEDAGNSKLAQRILRGRGIPTVVIWHLDGRKPAVEIYTGSQSILSRLQGVWP